MVPENEGQAWIEVPACDESTESTESTPGVFRDHMIEAARQREVALGFMSDLLATVAMQNGHIEAMVKHTNRLTKHSEMCCQDLHKQVRIFTEKLATEDDWGAKEADGFRVLKDHFIQNAADLERVKSERDRLHWENQDLRESPEVKRESSPRGGGSGKSGKSAKIPDPERLDNGVSPKYKAWRGDVVAKLTINEDWYAPDAARVAYCLSRLTGQANEAYTVENIMRCAARHTACRMEMGPNICLSTKDEPSAGGRVFSPEYQKRKEEGACYGCERKDHIARFCPKKRAGVNAVKQISDTRKVEELSDSDSGNEEA
ncbi:hypothetical protein E4U58_001036 [Claviceps cyperi]|nr:hypothetical protein E4U58_001036 [Claviceps cyperi]